MTVIFIRHGEADVSYVDQKGFMGQGRDLAPLSEKGKAQAEEVSQNKLLHDGQTITWRFHDDLWIEAFSENGEGYIGAHMGARGEGTHHHPEEEEMLEELTDILRGNFVFVSKIGLVGRYISGVYRREYFEKHKRRIKIGFGVRCMTSKGLIKE